MMRNKGVSKIVEMGDVQIKTKMGRTIVLKDVMHVLDLHLNPTFGGKLDEEGYDSYTGKGLWKLTKRSLVVARGKICYTLYKTTAKLCKGD